jgi:hypothetical protein
MASVDRTLEDEDGDESADSEPSERVRDRKDRPRRRSDAPAPRKRPRYEEEEEPAVVSGRFLIAVGMIIAGTLIPSSKLGEILEPAEPEATHVDQFAVGAKQTLRITLVTADYNLLGCAAEQSFEGLHCAFKTATEAWPRDPKEPPEDYNNKQNIIQPYRTWYDNKLVFVAGLWSRPDVAFRLHQEPQGNILPEKLARFAVECQVTFVGKLEGAKLRWNPSQNWTDPDAPAWVARAETCKLIEEPQ